MGARFLGVPLFVWAAFCLALAVVWVIFWPRKRAAGSGGLRYVILRWWHALTWLLLAAAAFIAGLNVEGGARLAKALSVVSLVVYLTFIGVLATGGKAER